MEFVTPPQLIDSFRSHEASALILLIICVFLGVSWFRASAKGVVNRRRFSRLVSAKSTPKVTTFDSDARPDPANPLSQLEIVSRSDYEKVRILNREEAKLLPLLEHTLRDIGQGHRVMAQTSLGELIKPTSGTADTHSAMAIINSKRLDFAVIDRFGWLICAVEYQGTGHHQSRAFLRDAVKREALRKAGVPMIEVLPDFRPETLAQSLRDTLAPAASVQN